MRRLFIANNTIDGISSLIVNRLLHRRYTDVIISNKSLNNDESLNFYDSITCVDIVPFNEEVFLKLSNSSKKIRIFTNNAPEWLSKHDKLKNVHVYTDNTGSLSYYNTLCYDMPVLEKYLSNINENKYKSLFARKCYMDYVDTIVHRITKII
jgi:hypothetical protein